MHITNRTFLKAPMCVKCLHITKLCQDPANFFGKVWRCEYCKTDYNYDTGDEIIRGTITDIRVIGLFGHVIASSTVDPRAERVVSPVWLGDASSEGSSPI